MTSDRDQRMLVCRCEAVSLATVLAAMSEVAGADELKRMTRVGMGVCQGRSCRSVMLRLLQRHAGWDDDVLSVGDTAVSPEPTSNAELTGPSGIRSPGYRNPVRPVPVGLLASLSAPTESAPADD